MRRGLHLRRERFLRRPQAISNLLRFEDVCLLAQKRLEEESRIEQSWKSLRRHLERSQHFTLVFIICPRNHSVVEEIRRRLASAISYDYTYLNVSDCIRRKARKLVQSLSHAIAADDARRLMRSPLWLSLDREPNGDGANRLRAEVLSALNRQRTHLERSFGRPLLLSLPKEYLQRTWEFAPDLWTIRGLVVDLSSEVSPHWEDA